MAVVKYGDRSSYADRNHSINNTNSTNIMTLTGELNNPHSLLYRWFESKQSPGGERLIKSHNQEMNQTRIIRPSGHIKDFALLGTSFVYAFRWYLGLLNRSFNQTVASYSLNSTIAEQLLSAKTSKEKAIACLIFAAYEQKYRSGSVHEIATVLMERDKNQLKPELNYVSAIIDDLVNLIDSISSVWDATNSSLTKRKYFLNPSFSGSWLETGESFKVKAEQVARYIRYQEALAEARKAEARRIRDLATQAENQAARLRKYLTNQMMLSGVNRIDGVFVPSFPFLLTVIAELAWLASLQNVVVLKPEKVVWV